MHTDDYSPLDELKARYYHWWTVKAWRDGLGVGVKLGPWTVNVYRWFDDRLRIGISFNFGPERIIFGGPLA